MSGLPIALLGAGSLGTAIGLRLLGRGIPVRAFNRSPARLATLVANGASAHDSPREAAAGAEHVLCVLTDTEATREVLLGRGGVLESGVTSLSTRRTIIDFGTHDPQALAQLAEQVEVAGSRFVEAPVTGSTHDAAHGTLNFLVGGDEDAVASSRPILGEIGRDVFHLGPVGAGSVAKLAMNQLVGTMAFALGESLAMLEAGQLHVPSFLDALNGSGLTSPLYQRLGQRYLTQDFTPRFSLGNLGKDLGLARSLAGQLRCPALLSERVSGFISELDPADHERDYSLLVQRIGECRA